MFERDGKTSNEKRLRFTFGETVFTACETQFGLYQAYRLYLGRLLMDARYQTWSTDRKYKAAIDHILNDGWTISEASRKYGINRSHLSTRVKKAKEAREARVNAAKEEAFTPEQVKTPTEDRMPFPEWFERYFGTWICPDCEVHHAMPDFHEEISEAIRGDYRRVLINIPPYHSKSTLVSVFDTVYDICYDKNLRTAIVSKSLDFAEAFVRQISEILTNEELYAETEGNLIDDFGPFKPEGKSTWNNQEIIVAGRTRAEKDPTVKALGFGNQIYGRRFDKIKFDDVATLENSKNPDRVMGMLEWIDKEALSRIGKSGIAIWIGTRVAPGDVYSTLQNRPGYKVIRYPALIDDELETVLWPEHFPYSQVLIHRSEMSPADFQLVYQNVDVPGLNASFTADMMEASKDTNRQVGHYESGWRLIAGLDPAGGNKGSGFTAMVLLAVDLNTGKRFVVDAVAERSMKAPRLKQLMFEWSEKYPIYEWRVESNGVQSQLVQYNEEIIQHLAKKGIRVVPHQTHSNKWDADFGVESLAPLFHAELVSIPWAGAHSAQKFQKLLEEFIAFPMGITSDLVMAFWFAELGIRDLLNRAHMPMFNERLRKKWPARIKRRARIVNFEDRSIRGVSLEDQRQGHLSRGQAGYRRMTVGQPTPHHLVEEFGPEEEDQPMNIDPQIWRPHKQPA